jgi:gluconokinase
MIVCVMGVSGAGKSTVARALAARFSGTCLDADDFHSAGNKAKLASGVALTDEDRAGWLTALNAALKETQRQKAWVFLACSALRRAYRARLGEGLADLHFLYLKGTQELIQARLHQRRGHFMNPELLASQFEILEEPEQAEVVSVAQPLEALLADAEAACLRFSAKAALPLP